MASAGTKAERRPEVLLDRRLPALAALAAVPGYDRSRVTVGVVHIGVGGFHRAHRARQPAEASAPAAAPVQMAERR